MFMSRVLMMRLNFTFYYVVLRATMMTTTYVTRLSCLYLIFFLGLGFALTCEKKIRTSIYLIYPNLPMINSGVGSEG